jgi:palmitoyltransferase ZDHHC9/14/18
MATSPLPPPQTFFCDGRCIAGPSWSALLGTSVLILAPCGVWLGLVVPDVARRYTWFLFALGLWLPLFSVVTLFFTGCSDPGIIPRIPPPAPDEFPDGRPRRAPLSLALSSALSF